MSPNGPRHVSGVRGVRRVPSYHGIAGETAEFDDFCDGRWSMKRPDSGEKYPTSLVYVMVGEIFFLKRTK
eukprot:scaffold48608_cov21-Cyclotella_meneghiniana.AAC.1